MIELRSEINRERERESELIKIVILVATNTMSHRRSAYVGTEGALLTIPTKFRAFVVIT